MNLSPDKVIPIAVGAGLLVSGGSLALYSNKKLKEAHTDQEYYTKNIFRYDKFYQTPSNRNCILQIDVRQPVSLIKIYKQKIMTRTRTVPTSGVSVGITQNINSNGQSTTTPAVQYQTGFVSIDTNYLGFSEYCDHSLVTHSGFGHNDIIANNKISATLNEHFYTEPDQEIKGFGEDIMKHLKDNYKCNFTLNSKKVYKVKFFTFTGKTVYLFGKRYGDRYLYDSYATDPETIINRNANMSGPQFGIAVGGMLMFGSMCFIVPEILSRL